MNTRKKKKYKFTWKIFLSIHLFPPSPFTSPVPSPPPPLYTLLYLLLLIAFHQVQVRWSCTVMFVMSVLFIESIKDAIHPIHAMRMMNFWSYVVPNFPLPCASHIHTHTTGVYSIDCAISMRSCMGKTPKKVKQRGTYYPLCTMLLSPSGLADLGVCHVTVLVRGRDKQSRAKFLHLPPLPFLV